MLLFFYNQTIIRSHIKFVLLSVDKTKSEPDSGLSRDEAGLFRSTASL